MILVTGGTGFIGSHLLERLVQSPLCSGSRNAAVRCLIRPKAVPRKLPAGVQPAPGDLARGEGLEAALENVDIVIHLAGVTKALRPADYYAGNARATENLARVVSRRPIRLVHVSSLAAVGPSPDGNPLDEDAETHPISHYGKSKKEAESIVRRLVPTAVIVRPPVVYGPRDTDVLQILKSVSRGLLVQISGGERWFSAIYVGDLVDGLLAAACSSKAGGRTYFLTHPEPVSWSELGQAAARIMSRRPRVLRVPLPLARALGFGAELWTALTRRPGILSRDKVLEAGCRWWLCDSRRAATELGFQARTPIESGLASTLAWYKEAGWLPY